MPPALNIIAACNNLCLDPVRPRGLVRCCAVAGRFRRRQKSLPRRVCRRFAFQSPPSPSCRPGLGAAAICFGKAGFEIVAWCWARLATFSGRAVASFLGFRSRRGFSAGIGSGGVFPDRAVTDQSICCSGKRQFAIGAHAGRRHDRHSWARAVGIIAISWAGAACSGARRPVTCVVAVATGFSRRVRCTAYTSYGPFVALRPWLSPPSLPIPNAIICYGAVFIEVCCVSACFRILPRSC